MVFWKRTAELKRRAEFLASQSFVVLAIHVPKDNDKKANSAEQFFAALHGIFRNDPPIQEHVSFEIVAAKDSITFYVFTPLHLKDFIEGQLYAQYPDLQIKQVADYTSQAELGGMHVISTEVKLTKEDVYPIKTYAGLEIDPLAAITAAMTNLEDGEQVWLQVLVRPVGDDWQLKGIQYVQAVKSGKKKASAGIASSAGRLAVSIVQEVVRPGSGAATLSPAPSEPPKLSANEESALKAIESKVTKLGFETLFRLSIIGRDEQTARARVSSVLAALKQFNTTNQNGFTGGNVLVDDFGSWEQYLNREFERKGNILNIEELASVYHFPSVSVETGSLTYAGSKKGEAVGNIPLRENTDASTFTLIGKTDFRNSQKEFGIKIEDRMRHMYIIGKSGSGKSTLQENMAYDDIQAGRGIVVIDPHGEFAEKMIAAVPEHRINDVVIIDPSDREFPVALNVLETDNENFKGMIASGFVSIFKKMFGNSWGPRLEYILRNTVLALLDTPGTTMLGIPRMLTDMQYRSMIVENIRDTVVRDYWTTEFAGMDAKMRAEAISPILNKVGQFLSTSTIRNIVGQPKSTIDIRKIMDEGKILIVNLCKGKIGEDNMRLLGSMIVTKVQLAAMSRADIEAYDRVPVIMYVDEFQNFATDSFAEILSEARKYALGLVIAHQYIAQLPDEVKDAVIGNVGTIVTFKIGAPDAKALQDEFAPTFGTEDMINLERGHVYIKLSVDGVSIPAFSALCYPPKQIDRQYFNYVVEASRATYARPRPVVEDEIEDVAGYKMKRQAQDAAKVAAGILQGGGGAPQMNPVQPTPASPVTTSPQFMPPRQPVQQVQNNVPAQQIIQPIAEPIATPPTPEPVANLVNEQSVLVPNSGLGQGTMQPDGQVKKPKKPRIEKPPKIMHGWVYKEASQRGGNKWFLAEPESDYKAKKAAKEAERAAKIAAYKAEHPNEEVPDDVLDGENFAPTTPPSTPTSPEQSTNKSTAQISDTADSISHSAPGRASSQSEEEIRLEIDKNIQL